MKLLDTIPVPEGTTHVAVHHVNGKGAMGRQLKATTPDGSVIGLFEVNSLSAESIFRHWGAGAYRFAAYTIDEKGEQIRIGPIGGAVEVKEPAPAANAPESPPVKKKKVSSGMRMFERMREIQREERAAAQIEATRAIERDRVFTQAVIGLVGRANAPPITADELKKAVKEAVEEELADEPGAPAAAGDPSMPGWAKELIDTLKPLAQSAAKAVGSKLTEGGNGNG